MRLVLLALFASVLPSTVAQAQTSRYDGPFAVGMGDADDGCIFQWRALQDAAALTRPSTVHGQRVRTVAAGRLVQGNDRSEALTVTLDPGIAIARRSVSFDATSYGARSFLSADDYYSAGTATSVRLRAGERLSLLASGPEGTVFFQVGGRVLTGSLPEAVETVQEPITQLWVHLVNRGAGRPASWLMVSSDSFQALDCEWGEGD